MDKIEGYVDEILEGRALQDESSTIIDYTIAEQVSEVVSKGALSEYKPVLRKTVTYIVVAVVINEKNEVLMMQEAKSSCAGQWYLPAGRMEPGENIMEAVCREMVEETGLEFEPTSLLTVENAKGHWYRFAFTGNITGGELKTVAKADAESLQANWFEDLKSLTLRADDILPLIDRAREYQSQPDYNHPSLLPAVNPHNKLLFRPVIIIRKRETNRIHVLVSEKEAPHIPLCEINPNRSVHTALKRFAQHVFGPDVPAHKPHGILTVEHSGSPANEHDGICLTMLVSFKVSLEEVRIDKPDLTWFELGPEVENKLLGRVAKNMTVPFVVR